MTPAAGARLLLLAALGGAGLWFGAIWLRALGARALRTGARESATGFVTIFFDTLGIGCFATTTACFRALRLVPDEQIPGTLNVGHAIAAVVSAFIFIQLIPVDLATLALMVVAAGLGSWLGSGIVPSLPRRVIRLAMGAALLIAATVMLGTQLSLLPGGGEALGLSGAGLALAVAGNFVFGALMTIGIGLYAPCLILISLLGMNPRAGFPIMMASCAFLMPIAGARFIRAGQYAPRAALGLTLGGIPALLIAAYLVKAMPLDLLRGVVIVVVVITGIGLLRAGLRERGTVSD